MIDLEAFRQAAKKKKEEFRLFYKKLKKQDPKRLDEHFHREHFAAFEEIDCLECANCCKTTSPIFYSRDIDRAAKALRMKPGDFIEKYLRIDEDKDYVLQTSPCPFLDSDNYCGIYDDRPTACREYPHTDRKKIVQIMDLTYRNSMVCPAVFRITEKLSGIF